MRSFFSAVQLNDLRQKRKHKECLIFLSGPSAAEVSLSLLRAKDIIAVNGSAHYLIDNEIKPFIYLVTDGRFPLQRFEEFKRFSTESCFTFINQEVYDSAPADLQAWLNDHCFILKELYKREKAGPLKKIRYGLFCAKYPSVIMDVPFSRKKRLKGFSKDITIGYCNCKTVAYAAIQLAYSLAYQKIICAGFDLTQGGQRFYDRRGEATMPSELSKDTQKIIAVLRFMKEKVNPPVYTLSTVTSIPYDIIPLIKDDENQ
ncbi:3-deoxy-D-manno-oct-2-ulosonate III transferase WaaZ [Rosenbergiella australiborealis]|uniref:3-deoxy-D-manno-oct-2-ulosonate III transferase WaaZ n=1 Tax=Rosenbergiella australiborealis TaxID=1544696 RepID=A0ABS5T4Z5_9GAMM|nr:3-deoxy-D-manno-oct-2-ulosonate III transferase WaaZ [Rosenbergiella australiborealis]MBT0727411.1 3-deoxy-D-manno-oct-2-ulosonate III transferase WaaZ [Rosenbergiella australiborealis]